MKKKLFRPSVAEISFSALKYNFTQIRKQIGPNPQIMGIVKANAYGHGSKEISKFLQKNKIVSCFGVAIIEEAIELRDNGIKLPILVLTHPSINQLELFLNYNVDVTIADLEIANKLDLLSKKNKTITPVHIKIDTGMGRIGIKSKEAKKFFDAISNFKNLKVKGIFTHFSSSDDFDLTKALKQLDEFTSIAKIGKEKFGEEVLIHAANSGAVLQLKNSFFDLVRPGVMIYGYYPTSETRKTFPLKKVMTLKSQIVYKKTISKNTEISYGGLYKSESETDIATIPYGYADGYPRLLTNKTEVIIFGKKYRVVGRICMDQMMIDLKKNSQIKVGDKVTLVGKDGNESIWFDELASKLNNLQYELMCNVAPRVKRIYIK